jgi:TonB family protein
MFDQKTGISKPGRDLPPPPPLPRRQQRLMVIALTLLVMSLVLVLYRDRDFWFPDTQQAAAQPATTEPHTRSASATASTDDSDRSKKKHSHPAARQNSHLKSEPPDPPPTVISTRTVLPPLEVEVVAGDTRRTLRPGSSAVHVDLQRSSPAQDSPAVAEDQTEAAAGTPRNAAERASIATNTAATIVTESVQPEYPMLARQMKVQGSVILQALIGQDGLIQDLRVLSGPPILATAAREAVKQWHFKPHYDGTRAVETRTNITVNFTISTN